MAHRVSLVYWQTDVGLPSVRVIRFTRLGGWHIREGGEARMDADRTPQATSRAMATRHKMLSFVFLAASMALVVVGLALLVSSRGHMDAESLRQQHIGSCLIGLGLFCLLFSQMVIPPARLPSWWLVLVVRALAIVALLIELSALALYIFAPASAESLAATLLLIAGMGLLLALIMTMLVSGVFGTPRLWRQAR
jgi:hypothetical protein